MGNTHNLEKELKIYKGVYIGLLFLTVVTVAVSYLHVPVWAAVIIALIVATFKASLVANFFMHLAHEKPLILWTMAFTVFFMLCMIALIIASQFDVYQGLYYES